MTVGDAVDTGRPELKRTLGTVHLWGLAVGLVISGEYFGWSYGWGVSGPLGFLVVYTPPGEDFFCAEPVSNATDAFNLAAAGRTDTGMLVL